MWFGSFEGLRLSLVLSSVQQALEVGMSYLCSEVFKCLVC